MLRLYRLCGATALAAAVSACGHGGHARAPANSEPRLEPDVSAQQWYRSLSICGQGPYELELPVAGARWGEDFELRVHTPRGVQIQAVVLADDTEVDRASGVFGAPAGTDAAPANTRCIADARERLTLARGGGDSGGSGGPATQGTVGTTVVVPPPDAPTAPPAKLELDGSLVTTSIVVARFGWREGQPPGGHLPGRIRIRFWSTAPNDLEGVLFGIARIEWRPNVSEEAYVAHLAAQADAARRADEEWRRRQAARADTHATATVTVDVEGELRAQRERERRAEDERRRRAIAVALEAERRARRAEYCARHPDDRDCWGAGGLRVHLELQHRKEDRERYCAAHTEDARCWNDAERARRADAWRERKRIALAPPRQPDGPPPAALEEVVPPKLSVHAEWRPGYWQWTGATWFWIGGMWRVPESDIVAEETTTAPAAPPPPQAETPPPSVLATAVWIPGFWQWSGRDWVWVAGSWQLRPAPRTTWRPPAWQVRGNVHVLVPGAWIQVGGR